MKTHPDTTVTAHTFIQYAVYALPTMLLANVPEQCAILQRYKDLAYRVKSHCRIDTQARAVIQSVEMGLDDLSPASCDAPGLIAFFEAGKRSESESSVRAELQSIPLPSVLVEEIQQLTQDTQTTLTQTLGTSVTEAESLARRLRSESVKIAHRPIPSRPRARTSDDELLVFLSHAHSDKTLALAISRDIESHGINTWRDDKDVHAGDSIPEQVGEAISRASHLVVLCSPESVARPWVKSELESAIARRLGPGRGRPVVIPIRVRQAVLPTMIGHIKHIELHDFGAMLQELLLALGRNPQDVFDLGSLWRFIRKLERAVELASGAQTADFFLPCEEELFEELVGLETFAASFALPPELIGTRFVYTATVFTAEEARPHFEDEFYIYSRTAAACAHLLQQLSFCAKRIIAL
jgi:hypothetical protein